MAEILKYATAAARPRDPDGFVMTETAEDILRSLELVRTVDGTAMTMIAGAPGVGKTRALHRFCASQGHDALCFTMVSGEGKATSVSETMLWAFRVMATGRSLPDRRNSLGCYIGSNRVVVFDEAQYFHREGIEWVRALAEEVGFDLVLVGDLALANLVAELPQLQSRMRRPVVIREASAGDVAAMVAGSPFDTAEAIACLHAVARLKGGLRNIRNVVGIAHQFADLGQPTLAHLKAAILDQKLGPREVR